MTKKTTPQTAAPAGPSEDDLAFERELVAKHPDRKIVRYDMPSMVEECAAIYMFKLRNRDDLSAAEMADANMTQAERKSVEGTAAAHHREGIRLSIVGIVTVDGAGHTTRRLVDQSRPLMEIDDWDASTWIALRTFHNDLNGLKTDELKNAVRDARKLAPCAPGSSTLPATAR